MALQCVERHWHCLIEKPAAIDVKDGEPLERLAQQNRRTVGVNHNKIWNPAFRTLCRLGRENALGEIRHVTIGPAWKRCGPANWLLRACRPISTEVAPTTLGNRALEGEV